MEDGNLTLASPWAIYASEVDALFELDDEVTVEYDNVAPRLVVRVANAVKADALAQLLPTERTFGNVTLGVSVVPDNDSATDEQLWRWAFDGNPAFAGVATDAMPDGSPVTFAMFEPECVQYMADDTTNPYGLRTRTYEQVARDVLEPGDVRVTSDLEATVGVVEQI